MFVKLIITLQMHQLREQMEIFIKEKSSFYQYHTLSPFRHILLNTLFLCFFSVFDPPFEFSLPFLYLCR